MLIDSNTKAILFDLDQTLLNSKTSEYTAICKFKKQYNEFNSMNEKKFAKLWSKITIELYEKYLKKEISFETLRIQRIKKIFLVFNVKVEDKEAKEKFENYLELYRKSWILFDDVIDVLDKLKDKYILAIVTNGDAIQQREKLQKTGIEKYFSQIIISSEVGVAKPNEEIFEIACEKLKVLPQECIMVGDKFTVDIEGSVQLGIKAIWVNRKNENIEYEYKIKELHELLT